MSLWDRQLDFGNPMHTVFEESEQFILFSIDRDTPFINPADAKAEPINTRTKMIACKLDPETGEPVGLKMEVKSLASPIFELAGAKRSPGDLPAVVYYDRVEVKSNAFNNEATVLRFMSPFPIPDDLRP